MVGSVAYNRPTVALIPAETRDVDPNQSPVEFQVKHIVILTAKTGPVELAAEAGSAPLSDRVRIEAGTKAATMAKRRTMEPASRTTPRPANRGAEE